MRLFLRGSIATVLLLVLVGCGVTGDDLDEAGSTTSTTSTTTEGGTSEGNDPELEALLLTEADFEVAVELDPDEDDAFEEELCDGQTFTVVPERQAATGFVTASEETVVAQAIAEFDFEDDASLFIEELQSLNEQCKAADDDGSTRSRRSRSASTSPSSPWSASSSSSAWPGCSWPRTRPARPTRRCPAPGAESPPTTTPTTTPERPI